MPYDVSGWVEVLWDWTLEEEKQIWESVINLDRFVLHGDEIANQLFGLSKSPDQNAYFAGRGIPDDCCIHVNELVKDNTKFEIKYPGDGWLNPTHALWSEIEAVLPQIKQDIYVKENWDMYLEWQTIFNVTRELTRAHLNPEWIRFVVWGIW